MVVARRDHPIVAQGITMESYLAHAHALTSPGAAMTGIVDDALATMGYQRTVAVAVPYFLATLATVAASDLIATMPRRLAVSQAASFGLVVGEPPLALRRFPVKMTWSRRAGTDPAIIWLRSVLTGAASRLDAID